MKNLIACIKKGSIAEEAGIEVGDILLEINGKKVKDIFDYRFLTADYYIEVLIKKQNGEEWLLEIEKEEYEDLGLSFNEPMMDKAQSCTNKCIFCFIEQLPKGMRETLYFKDDDSRLSFLQGSYVTLTNMKKADLDRIIYYHLSPINVSVHTTDENLRAYMLGNKKNAGIVKQLERISQSGIEINCQIVLVKGVNDGEALRKTIKDLERISGITSVSVVPVGLTKHREGLAPLLPLEKDDAAKAIEIIEAEQGAVSYRGTRFVYASDELYIKAGVCLPPYDAYDGFPQLENGVGMMRLFEREFEEEYKTINGDNNHRKVTIITGESAFGFINNLVKKILDKFTNTEIKVIMVKNEFFGDTVTVSGLVTGKNIMSTLQKNGVKGKVLLPSNCLKAGEDIFLDDVTLEDINNTLGIKVVRTDCNGKAFIAGIVNG